MATRQTKQNRLSYLIENELEKTELVLAIEAITDDLQTTAEDFAKIEADQIMPMLDSLKTAFGPQVADQFSQAATEQLRGLVDAVRQAKDAINSQVNRMKGAVDGGAANDMADDLPEPGMDDAGGLGGDEGLGDAPPDDDDMSGSLPDDAKGGSGMDDLPLDTEQTMNAAGRAKKESALRVLNVRGIRSLMEADDYKSASFDSNLNSLSTFDPRCGALAHATKDLIEAGRFNGEERKGLGNVLSHLAAFASDNRHWEDPDAKTEAALRAAWVDMRLPDVRKIVLNLKKLAHLISFKHEGMIESRRVKRDVARLREASNPDDVVLGAFRKALRETKSPARSLRRVAERFAIDASDVVVIVREAKRLSEQQPVAPKTPAQLRADKDAARQQQQQAAAVTTASGAKPAPGQAPGQPAKAPVQGQVGQPPPLPSKPVQPVQGGSPQTAQNGQQSAAKAPSLPAAATQPVAGQAPPMAPANAAQGTAGRTASTPIGQSPNKATAADVQPMPGEVVDGVPQPEPPTELAANMHQPGKVNLMSKPMPFPKPGAAIHSESRKGAKSNTRSAPASRPASRPTAH